MYGFDSNTLTYLLTKLKSKLATRADLDKKQDKEDGKQLSSNDFTDALKEKTNNIFKEVSLSYDDSTYTYSLDFKRHNETVEKVAIKSKKKMPMGIITEAEDTVILDAMRNVTFKIKVAGDSLSVKDYYYRLTVYSYGAADSLLSTVTNNYDVNSLDNNEINYQLKLSNLYKKIIFKRIRTQKKI